MKFNTNTEKIKIFESIYSTHSDTVYKVCLWLVKKEDCAEMLAKQTFIDAYELLDLLDEQNILTYLVCHAKELAEQYKPE